MPRAVPLMLSADAPVVATSIVPALAKVTVPALARRTPVAPVELTSRSLKLVVPVVEVSSTAGWVAAGAVCTRRSATVASAAAWPAAATPPARPPAPAAGPRSRLRTVLPVLRATTSPDVAVSAGRAAGVPTNSVSEPSGPAPSGSAVKAAASPSSRSFASIR